MKPGMSKYSYAIFALLVFGLSACTPPASKHSAKGAAKSHSGEVLAATFNNQSISLREIDAELGESLYEARKHTATRMAFEAILNEKAKQQGVTTEELMKKEIEARTEAPTEEAIRAVFEASKAQLPPEMTFESVRGDIENYLRSQSSQKVMPELQEAWLAEAQFKFVLSYEPKRVEVEATGPSKGPKEAKVTLVEFSDFGCSFCKRGAETIAEIVKAYPTQVKVHFRHFAMRAAKASEAALCADEQGKFWEYHDILFENQGKQSAEDLKEHAKTLALDEAKFAECLEAGRHAAVIQKDIEAGHKAGVRGTPAFFINGILISGAQPLEKFKELIEQELQAK